MPIRPLNRSLNRSTARRITRYSTRLTPGARRPDYLRDLLFHLRAAIRNWRRLIRLAPEIFDYNVAKRADIEFAKTAARHREALTALAKVYGEPLPDFTLASPSHDPFWCKKGEEKVKRLTNYVKTLSPDTCQTIDLLLAQITASQVAISEKLATYARLRPHDVPSLNRIADLTDAAFTLARVACCIDTTQPSPDPSAELPDDPFERDLARLFPPDPPAPPEPGNKAASQSTPCCESPCPLPSPIPESPKPAETIRSQSLANAELPQLSALAPDAYARATRMMKALSQTQTQCRTGRTERVKGYC